MPYITNNFLLHAFTTMDGWFARLSVNMFVYAAIYAIGYAAVRYLQPRAAPNGALARALAFLTVGGGAPCGGDGPAYSEVATADNGGGNKDGGASAESSSSPPTPEPERSTQMKAALLAFCFCGLQGAYLSWGYLQERVMTREYSGGGGGYDSFGGPRTERFTSSQFLVFTNRVCALLVAACVVRCTQQPRHRAPFYMYSFTSLSNILSSWCQYEALKFVTFPTQVLSKSSKLIPVMLMGWVISRKRYVAAIDTAPTSDRTV